MSTLIYKIIFCDFCDKLQQSLILLLLFVILNSCKKLISIPPPDATMTSKQVFATANEATSAAAAIYSNLSQGNNSFASYSTTIFCGLSADELAIAGTRPADWMQFYQNDLFAGNTVSYTVFWINIYEQIYRANALLEGLSEGTSIPDSIKRELEGESRFLRAFCNFYLVNLFGPVPLVTSTNWRKTNNIARATVQDVYQQIVMDLIEAKALLSPDYSVGQGERIIPNRTAASALLARVYLYLGNWISAEDEAASVINDTSLRLEPLSNVFKFNSKEAIWQLKQNNTRGPSNNATPEGYFIRPRSLNSNLLPAVWATSSFLDSIQTGDRRGIEWIDSTKYTLDKKSYYFPGKYKQGPAQAAPNGPYVEYYMVLRLAEQYLIRAEARLKQNNLTGATIDINLVRKRAGLEELPSQLSAKEIMAGLVKERQIELFAEWGHRWLDLKRWKMADQVLSLVKGAKWQSTDLLYPIPESDLARNSNLSQNEGY